MVVDISGAVSILCWLFAQFPQIVENHSKGQPAYRQLVDWALTSTTRIIGIRSQGSVEGLALPFLLSWLFGDITNIVGCLLTDQLPFQVCSTIHPISG